MDQSRCASLTVMLDCFTDVVLSDNCVFYLIEDDVTVYTEHVLYNNFGKPKQYPGIPRATSQRAPDVKMMSY